MADDGALAVPVGPDDHVRGPAGAPVTLVEYGDFECPYCRAAYAEMRRLEERYAAQLRFVFRSFPLEQHPHARAAAEAAEFAADAGKFWEMYDRLFTGKLAAGDLRRHAEAIGLDGAALDAALRAQTYAPVIDDVKEGGEASGIPGTPAFFLNGVLFEDEPSYDNLAHAVDWLLEHASS